MSMVPIDKQYDELLAKKARESGESKADILRRVLSRAAASGPGGDLGSPQDVVKALSSIPSARPGSLAEEMQEMAKSMFFMGMIQNMQQPRQAPQQESRTSQIQEIFLIKELTKPSIYELMMMERLNSGQEAPKWLENMANEQKETRELLTSLLGVKQEEDRINAIVNPLVEQMAKDRETMTQNQKAILEYISKGESSPRDTIEAYIASALKERLTEEALDAIDRGLFKKQEVMTPEGSFNWKAVLDRMLNIGEEIVKKMPQRAPPIQAVRLSGGQMVNPVTGQVLTPQEVAVFQQSQQALQVTPQAPQQAALPTQLPASQPAEMTEEDIRKKKASEATDLFMSKGGEGSGEEEQPGAEQQANEPTGNETY